MPNWCSNTLYVRGDDDKQVKAFVDSAKDENNVLSFYKHVPSADTTEAHRADWGTKWDAAESELVDHFDGRAEYTFMTAWCPPDHWLCAISKQFPTLTFQLHYDEPGMCFKGVTDAENGELKDQSISY